MGRERPRRDFHKSTNYGDVICVADIEVVRQLSRFRLTLKVFDGVPVPSDEEGAIELDQLILSIPQRVLTESTLSLSLLVRKLLLDLERQVVVAGLDEGRDVRIIFHLGPLDAGCS